MSTVTPTGETQPQPTPESLSRRLGEFYEQAGFFPHSNRELSLGRGAIDNAHEAGGFAKYLNRVLEHQFKAKTEKPQAALELIVKEVSGFMSEANAARSFAFEIWDELDDAEPYDDLHSIFGDDWKVQSSTKRGLKDLQRRSALDDLLREEQPTVTKIEQLTSDGSIDEMTRSLTVLEAKRHLDSLTIEELARADFWREQLQSARQHMVVTAISDRALRILR